MWTRMGSPSSKVPLVMARVAEAGPLSGALRLSMVAPKVTASLARTVVSGALSALHPVRVARVVASVVAVIVIAVASHRRMLCRRMAFGVVWLCIFMFSYSFISCLDEWWVRLLAMEHGQVAVGDFPDGGEIPGGEDVGGAAGTLVAIRPSSLFRPP